MKYFKLLSLLTSFCILVACTSPPTIAMTFNIRYDNPNDGDNWWDIRKTEVVELLKNYQADFIGLQEALPSQTTFIADHLEQYNYIGYGRDGKGTNSEGAPIFYNTTKYDLVETKMIWLSETPDTISRGWDAALNRITVYGAFKHKSTDETIHVFNAHFDHRGELARLRSAELLVDFIRNSQLENEKVILMGDFNAQPTDGPIQMLTNDLTDSYNTPDISIDGPFGTFNGFDTTAIATRRIDYIFTKNAVVKSYRCIDDRRKNNLHVSDHFALVIALE